jgi:hypothetical protein
MGLDYSINLYFPARSVGAALRAYAQFAPLDRKTTVRLIENEVSIPFSSDWKHDPIELLGSGNSISLETCALFPIDDAIRQGAYGYNFANVGGTEFVQIGYIYLTVRLGCLYSELSFTAATSGMSRLFESSDAIRGRFREVLEAADGVAGWLDKEDFEVYSLIDPNQTIVPELNPQTSDENADLRLPDWQAAMLCQGLGRPLPAVDSIARSRTADAIGLAKSIRSTNSFEVLPILADALQDAGCDNADVLNHCRGGSPHVRGCWVVDLVLGKS